MSKSSHVYPTSFAASLSKGNVRQIRPKFLFFGDPHSSFEYVVRCVQKYEPEAIILLGDIQAQRPLQVELAPILDLTEVWWIPGNHDTDSDADHHNLFGSELAHRNLHGRVVGIAGVRVAGLGGIFRESIWAPPLEPAYRSAADRLKVIRDSERWRGDGLPRRHRSSIFSDEYERLARQRADILVTHEGLGGHPHGWKALDDLAISLDVQLVVHGHLHQTIDYVAEGRLDPDAGYRAFGVAPEHCLALPLDPAHSARGLA